MAEASGNPFWDFSLAIYERPGVPEACLGLQDRHGLDVNLLLFCCWAGSRGRALAAGDMARLVEAAGPWHDEVVRPLRAARRWLKGQTAAPAEPTEALREAIKAQELEAERLAQLILLECLEIGMGQGSAPAAAGNLKAYLAAAEVHAGIADAADLAALLITCFANLPPLEALRLLG
ncbi:MAG: TIGR02444 family protein [Rhodospirillales bacterium]|nr:TIGR02444 family protein [Rhodospirillales bacterium]